jgi:hypothetical protein
MKALRTRARYVPAALIIAAAAVLWHHLPANTQISAPFDVHGRIGTPVTGRTLAVTVGAVQLAPAAELGSGRFREPAVPAAGRWVVVNAAVSALLTSVRPTAELQVGHNTYAPSIYSLGGLVDPGINQRGSWGFDVAAELVDPDVARPFQLRVWTGDGRLDTRLVIDLESRAPTRLDVITVNPPKAGG